MTERHRWLIETYGDESIASIKQLAKIGDISFEDSDYLIKWKIYMNELD